MPPTLGRRPAIHIAAGRHLRGGITPSGRGRSACWLRAPDPETMVHMNRFGRELAFLTAGILTCTVAFVVVLSLLAGRRRDPAGLGRPAGARGHGGLRTVVRRPRACCLRASLPGRLPAHAYRTSTRWWDPVLDPQVWRDVLHAILGFAVLLTVGLVGLFWTLGAIGLTSFIAWEWALPRGDVSGLFGLVTGDDSRVGEIVVNTALGLVSLALAPLVVRAMAATRFAFSRALLTNPAAILRARAEQAEASRDASTRAESHTLSMIERSIHDGPQQRLVRLTMDLQAAQRRMRSEDQDTAATYLDEAVQQSREVLEELRAVSRGIAPPVLSERGLVSAVMAAASRCPVDTVVDTDVGTTRRYDEEVEAAAYFVVSEALTNVAKHSGANHAAVSIVEDGGLLVLRVEDDGNGGAHVGKGHGLAGLEARVTGVRGRIHIASPAGGPTVVTAMLPRGAA